MMVATTLLLWVFGLARAQQTRRISPAGHYRSSAPLAKPARKRPS
jgi:hypothetical protein